MLVGSEWEFHMIWFGFDPCDYKMTWYCYMNTCMKCSFNQQPIPSNYLTELETMICTTTKLLLCCVMACLGRLWWGVCFASCNVGPTTYFCVSTISFFYLWSTTCLGGLRQIVGFQVFICGLGLSVHMVWWLCWLSKCTLDLWQGILV